MNLGCPHQGGVHLPRHPGISESVEMALCTEEADLSFLEIELCRLLRSQSPLGVYEIDEADVQAL